MIQRSPVINRLRASSAAMQVRDSADRLLCICSPIGAIVRSSFITAGKLLIVLIAVPLFVLPMTSLLVISAAIGKMLAAVKGESYVHPLTLWNGYSLAGLPSTVAGEAASYLRQLNRKQTTASPCKREFPGGPSGPAPAEGQIDTAPRDLR